MTSRQDSDDKSRLEMRRLKREIFDEWTKPKGPCADCILRGSDVEPRYCIGNLKSDIAFIGWTPGESRDGRKKWKNIYRNPMDIRYEDLCGFLATYWDEADREGKGGKWRFAGLFDRMLDPIGMTRRDVYFTNAVKCAKSGRKGVDGAGLLQCHLHLKRELDTLKPRLLVTFGPHALRSVLTYYGMTDDIEEKLASKKLHGKIRSFRNKSAVVLSLLHWGNVNRIWNELGIDSGLKFSDSCVKHFRLSSRMAGFSLK